MPVPVPVPVPVPDWAGRWFLRSVCFVPVMLLSGGCERSPTLVEFSGRIMGTTFAVKVRSLPEGVARESVAAAIRERLDEVNSKMSTYLPDSELSRFNTHAGTEWFPVSRETATVVAAALEVARQTGGAFDPTVGPLVDPGASGREADAIVCPPIWRSHSDALSSATTESGFATMASRCERRRRT